MKHSFLVVLALSLLGLTGWVAELAYARDTNKPKRWVQNGPTSGPHAYTHLDGAGVKRKNKVKVGPGSQRRGKTYIVKRDVQTGAYYHVYGRGKKAHRVKLNKNVANAYGYPATS